MGERIRVPAPDPDPSSEPPPVPRGRRWSGGLYLVAWTLSGILFVGPIVARHASAQKALLWADVAPFFIGWYLWGLIFPFTWWMARRWPFERRAELREKELVASRLEGQLAQANLRMLKMQLHPHFLFNTLNAISALMHSNVDAADKMISQLSDLLRMALEKDDRHQIQLEKELDFLNRYLAIEQTRFRDRLKVEIDVEPACLKAQVPRLILQPLVENAIRHGIAMRSAAGRVKISASRGGLGLKMMVADDGPGLTPNRPLRPGVGLANTRDRLEQLYGEDHGLELGSGDGGGFEVHIEIPFETKPRLEDLL